VGEYCLRNIDLRAAATMLDFLNLMGYDFTGQWSDVSGHHAQLFSLEGPQVHSGLRKSCSRGLDYLGASGFDNQKVLLGIPAYARYFLGALAPGQPFKRADAGEVEYRDLPREWIVNAVVDKHLCTVHIVDDKDKGFVSFDVPATVRMKAEWVVVNGLAGLFYWTGISDSDDEYSLVNAGFESLMSY
jgi:chitinase